MAKCWEPYRLVDRQSAGNLWSLSSIGILRDSTPKPPHNKLLGSYLAGLIEGDGTIRVPKTTRDDKGRLIYPAIQIVFNKKYLPLILILQKTLSFATIQKKKGAIYTINNRDGILSVIDLVYHYMRTPKLHKLQELIDWYPELKGIEVSRDVSPIASNAWLSGFIDSDGHFSIRATEKKIESKFELVQVQKNHQGYDHYSFLLEIAQYLKCDIKGIRMNRPRPEYRIRTLNLESNLILINYLNLHPLRSSW